MRSVNKLIECVVYNNLSDIYWYRDAQKDIQSAARRLDIPASRLSDLLALFSPRVGVKKSINLTLAYINTGNFRYDTLRGVRAAVTHWEETGIIRGPKTSRFARCLAGDQLSVVLDIWMARVFNINDRLWTCRGVYAEGARRICEVADHMGWTPAQTQAALWSHAVIGDDTRYIRIPRINIIQIMDEALTLHDDAFDLDPTEDVYHNPLPV